MVTLIEGTEENYIKEIDELTSKTFRLSDREAVIVAIVTLDDVLTSIIDKRLIQIKFKNETGWYNSTSFGLKHRICLAYAVGILDDEFFCTLLTYNKIRNKFAHQINCDNFDSDGIRDLVSETLSTASAQKCLKIIDRHLNCLVEKASISEEKQKNRYKTRLQFLTVLCDNIVQLKTIMSVNLIKTLLQERAETRYYEGLIKNQAME